MKSSKRAKSFFVVVRDHDRKVFSVHGPMNDDAMITTLVHEAQDAGRTINHSSSSLASIEAVTNKAGRDSGYSEIGNALSVD